MNKRIYTVLAIVVSAACISPVQAKDGSRAPLNASYKEECGSCHVAFPPGLLPADGWKDVMTRLDRHFGTDARVEPAAASEIGRYLEANAARPRDTRYEPSTRTETPRITETAWFRRKHRDGHDGLTAEVWKSPAVKSPANCGACHRQAADGQYGERDIQIPRSK